MASGDVPEALRTTLDEVVTGFGYDLDDVELTGGRVLRVLVDADEPPTLDDIAEVTRAVSVALDDADPLGPAPYTLEVSSRGATRPLTLPRHWRRNADRWVRVVPRDGDAYEGRIVAAGETSATLATTDGQREVVYDDVRRAKIEPELKRKDV